MCCTVAAGLLPLIINDVAQRHSEVRLTTQESDPDHAALDLRHGHLALAFLLDYPDVPEPWLSGITFGPVGMDEVYLAAPTGWRSTGVWPVWQTSPTTTGCLLGQRTTTVARCARCARRVPASRHRAARGPRGR